MGFSIDYSKLTDYFQKFSTMSKDLNRFLREFLIEQAERVLAKVKPLTPVDTGELKRHWELGEITGSGKDIAVEILNGMEYATEIEYGHRIVVGGSEVGWYEGRFMLKTSLDIVYQQMPFRYEKAFKEFLKKNKML